jgi:hypothetical protein
MNMTKGSQRPIWNTSNALIWKHILIETVFNLKNTQLILPLEKPKYSRKLNTEALETIVKLTADISEDIKAGKLDDANNFVERIMKEGITPLRDMDARKAKPWFYAICYKERGKTLEVLQKARISQNPSDLWDYAEIMQELQGTTEREEN